MASTVLTSSRPTAGSGRHRAAPAATPLAVLRARTTGLAGAGRPVVGHRRAAVAGIALATAAVGTGLLGPALVGGDTAAADRAEDRDPVPTLLPATMLELVSGRSPASDPVPARRGDEARDARGDDAAAARRGGAVAAAAAEAPTGTPATGVAAPVGPGPAAGERDVHPIDGSGTSGETDGTSGGTSGEDTGDGSPVGDVVDTVVKTTEPVRAQLPAPVGDVVDDTATVVEGTVAGTLGGIVP